jgi:hypothetical protein
MKIHDNDSDQCTRSKDGIPFASTLIITDPHNAHQFFGSSIFLLLSSLQCYNPIRPVRRISETIGLRRNRISENVGNTNFGNIDNLLSLSRSMEYIARYYNVDLPLVWALRLEGKIDQEKFK